jgi:two-component system phosphate regulon sensor histidine kinase PhoR
MAFRTKLLASHVGLVAVASAFALTSLERGLSSDLVGQLDQRLEEQARGAVEWAHEGGRRHPEKVAKRIASIVFAEVTLFDGEGAVLGASSDGARSDVGDEVAVARRDGIGRGSRRRGGVEMHLVAVRSPEGVVVRLGAPLSEINGTVSSMQRRLLYASSMAIAIAIVLGVLASRLASRPLSAMTKTAARLAEGDFDVPIPTNEPDEFGTLWRSLASLAQQLKARIGELVSERDRLSAILAGMAEAVLVLDGDERVVLANAAAERLAGAPGVVVGRRLAEVVRNAEARRLIARCSRGEVEELELEVAEHEGEALSVYVRLLSTSERGRVVVAVLRDLTALRKLTAMRRDFVANVSHELRTPVAAIQGYAETLLDGKTDPETSRQFLEIVHRQAARIGSLVEQLLALSEIEGRDKAPVREVLSVADVTERVIEAVRGSARTEGVSLEVAVPGDLRVVGDPDALERSLLNVVENAVKYGREHGTVRVSASPMEGGKVSVEVADDGPGIAPEHLPRLFERFYRVDVGRSRKQGGAGLGLAIVRHLVESMEGTVSVRSVPGEGTTFTFAFPAA